MRKRPTKDRSTPGAASSTRPAARPQPSEIRLRLVIQRPVPGVALSLQDKRSQPVDRRTAAQDDVVFDVAVRVGRSSAKGWRFSGDHVRSEGPIRQFVYVGVGKHAGQVDSPWDRRMKIDIHDIPAPLLAKATTGAVLEAAIAGTGADGTPACASVPLTRRWRAV